MENNNILEKIKVIRIKSFIGKNNKHNNIIKCLGLRKIGSVVYLINNSSIRGMIKKVFYMVKVVKL